MGTPLKASNARLAGKQTTIVAFMKRLSPFFSTALSTDGQAANGLYIEK
jgi:hypothetical protein